MVTASIRIKLAAKRRERKRLGARRYSEPDLEQHHQHNAYIRESLGDTHAHTYACIYPRALESIRRSFNTGSFQKIGRNPSQYGKKLSVKRDMAANRTSTSCPGLGELGHSEKLEGIDPENVTQGQARNNSKKLVKLRISGMG